MPWQPPERSVRLVAIAAIVSALPSFAASCASDDGDSGEPTVPQATRLDPQRSAQEVSRSLEDATGMVPESVTCAEGIATDAGATSRCELVDGGATYGVTVAVLGTEGDEVTLDVTVDDEPAI